NNPPTADVSFGLISSNTAEGLVSPSSLTFTPANWNVPQAVTVTGVDDPVVDGDVGYSIVTAAATSADAAYNGLNPADVSVSNSDNDSAVVSFAAAGISQSELTPLMFFSVTLSNPVESGVTLSVNSADGTATAADYTPISATVSFPPGSTLSQVVMVTIANDALDEVDENFTLTLSGLTATGNVTLGTAVATGTILDDDATPTLSITSPSLNEGNGGPSTMNFVVSLSAVSGRNVSFTGATTDGSATIADNDYVALASTPFTIPAGQTSLTIPVTINGDTVFEGNETFSVNLSGIANATPGTLTGTGTILEDDQQSTTTTITVDLPDPSVVGQAYPVNVTVASQTLSPTGTVTISDGSASCGPVTLTAGTAPNSTASCSLTSTTAGAKTLTASYTAATTAFGNSSGTTAHQVNPAGTSISVTGPTRSRINQPSSFSFALSVNSPGAGTPTGTVTLSSGASSCTATLPATSCNLSFNTLGTRTVSASYAGDGNFSASSSSGAGNAPTLVYALADLSVTKNDGVTTYEPGDLLVYSVIVRNLGPDAAANIRITDIIPTGLSSVVWSCDASGGGVCPVSGGAGNLDVTIASFPVGGLLNFTFYGNVAGSPASISNTASLTLPADTTIEDPVLGNNSATDSDLLEFLFRNGFEDPLVNAPTGSLRIPALALVRTLADEASIVLRLTDARGEAVRVYARLHEATIQYAVAGRGANGLLRLGAWTALPGEPTLSWTARQVADGWVVETVELR
ncbi:MAG: Ig-like domain repeat protein, partial [Rhodanobacteraceae bacterium]|nr:Ig-like domain repeat protein [Rhodanobacteraceae bacterium]